MPLTAELEAVGHELARIEEAAKYAAQGQFEQAKLWKAFHWLLGIPAAALAAASGGSLLADAISPDTAAILALASAVLGGIVTTIGAAQRGQRCQTVGNDYLALQAKARIAREVDLPVQQFAEARAQLGELDARRDEINHDAPTPNRFAYWRAKRNIEKGGQTYEVDAGA